VSRESEGKIPRMWARRGNLESVHASEIGRDLSQSVYLEAGVELLVE